MKRAYLLLLALVALIAFQSCKENETYADKKKKERSAINDYIVKHKIKQISEAEFFAQNNTTDTLKNERSEEHTSELQSRQYLVCRLLLEKKMIASTLLL